MLPFYTSYKILNDNYAELCYEVHRRNYSHFDLNVPEKPKSTVENMQ